MSIQNRESDLDRVIKEIGLNNIDYVRKHRLGTCYVLPNGWKFKYVKIDLGSAGKINGKIMRNIQYRWIQVPL